MRMLNLALAGLFSLSLAAQAAKDKKAAPAPAPKTETKKAEPKAAPAPTASGFVGNKDSKIYHKADCKTAAKMKAENKMSFASKAEAEKAGYKACKVCKAGA